MTNLNPDLKHLIPTNRFARIAGAVLFATVLLSGCATPQTRMEDYPEAYASATPEQQELLKQGKVALGMTPDMVKIALGSPDQVTELSAKDGTYITWHYASDVSPYPYGYPIRPFRGWIPPVPTAVAGVADKFRVVFFDNLVVSAERTIQ